MHSELEPTMRLLAENGPLQLYILILPHVLCQKWACSYSTRQMGASIMSGKCAPVLTISISLLGN